MKYLAPWIVGLGFGIFTTIALAVLTPIWMIVQIGRPVDFAFFLVVVCIPGVLRIASTPFEFEEYTMLSAIVCGLVFSIPIAAFCWALPDFLDLHSYKDIPSCGYKTVVGSVIVMMLATVIRKIIRSLSKRSTDSAEDN